MIVFLKNSNSAQQQPFTKCQETFNKAAFAVGLAQKYNIWEAYVSHVNLTITLLGPCSELYQKGFFPLIFVYFVPRHVTELLMKGINQIHFKCIMLMHVVSCHTWIQQVVECLQSIIPSIAPSRGKRVTPRLRRWQTFSGLVSRRPAGSPVVRRGTRTRTSPLTAIVSRRLKFQVTLREIIHETFAYGKNTDIHYIQKRYSITASYPQ